MAQATNAQPVVRVVSETRLDDLDPRNTAVKPAQFKINTDTGRVEQDPTDIHAPTTKEIKLRADARRGEWPVETVKEPVEQVIVLPPAKKLKGIVRFGSMPKIQVGAPKGKTRQIVIGLMRFTEEKVEKTTVRSGVGEQIGGGFAKSNGKKSGFHSTTIKVTPTWVKNSIVPIKISTVRTKKCPIEYKFPLKDGTVMIFYTTKKAIKHIADHYKEGDKLITIGQPEKVSRFAI